jgi:hypothetical protein
VQRYGEKGLVILGLNDESDPAKAAEFVRSKQLNYAVLPRMGDTFKAYGHRSYPTNIFVGRDGTVRERQVGFSEQDVVKEIEELLAEK